jgi:hypothetical protein
VPVHPYKKDLQEIWKSGRQMLGKSRLVKRSALVSVFVLAIMVALPAWRILPLASQTPFIALHYNIYLGVDRFGPVWHIFFLPALGLLFLTLNLFIQARSFRQQKTLALFFAVTTPVLQLVLLVAMVLIILINI